MLYIRTDMNDQIATGHMMRCIAIADAAKRCGEDTVFILADEQAAALLEKRKYPYIILHTQWNDLDAELPYLKQLIKDRQIKSILIDSYQVTECYLKNLTAVVKTIYIDDLNAFIYPVNGIICYANYWEKFNYNNRYDYTKLYLGTKYVPLRKEFSACGAKKIRACAEKLLILSGGTDHQNVLGQLLQSLNFDKYIQADVICGRYDKNYEKLRNQYVSSKNIHIHRNVTAMDQYMKDADLAVSAGGTALYELCAAGTPTISYSVADNQYGNVRKFHEDAVIDYAGDARRDPIVKSIHQYLTAYYADQNLRQERSQKMQRLVDGKGANRIYEIFKEIEETDS